MDVVAFIAAVTTQDAAALREYFASDAVINWHDSNESFTVDEYIRANCEYPGDWQGNVVRVHRMDDVTVTVAKIYSNDFACYVTSFATLGVDGKIVRLDEYFSDCGEVPKWRKDMNIGMQIID